MRFRSLVVSWCVCAIHGSVQIASGHRSLDVTSRSTYHPPDDIKTLLTHSPRNIPNLPSSVLLLPVFRPRFPSRYAVDAISKLTAGVDERTGRRKSVKSTTRATAEREKIVEFSAKSGFSRERRKKCSCRKREGRKTVGPSLLRDKAGTELNKSSIPKSLIFIPVGTTNVSASTMSPTESTTLQRFMDIAFTTTDATPSTVNAMTITEAAKIATKEADNPTGETYRRNLPRKRCKKIKCMMKYCKKRKMNVMDVLDQEFLQDDLGNVTTS